MLPDPYFATELGRIYLGDSLHLIPHLDRFGAIVTDPPYSSGGQFRSDRVLTTRDKYVLNKTAAYADFSGDNRDQRAYHFWSVLWLSLCHHHMTPGGPVCLFSDVRQLPITSDILQAAGYVWRGIGVWDKTEGARPVLGRFRNQCEYVVWGTRGPAAGGGQALPGVWRQAVGAEKKHHIAGKPLAIMAEVVRIAKDHGPVLDPFFGSGTTGLACERLGIPWVGIELDPTHCAIAAERIAVAEKQPQLFAPGAGQLQQTEIGPAPKATQKEE